MLACAACHAHSLQHMPVFDEVGGDDRRTLHPSNQAVVTLCTKKKTIIDATRLESGHRNTEQSGYTCLLLPTCISATLGDYSTEKIINKAVVTQEDFKREYYGSNSFDIGTIERTPLGVISKFPIATLYGFYGPSVLSINNIVMLQPRI